MKGSSVTCDSSVLVAAMTGASPYSSICRQAIGGVSEIPAHVLLETYRVLTTLPGEERVPPQLVAKTLASLHWEPRQLPAEQYLPLIQKIAEARIAGGPIYDAQIAATAKHHGLKLLSRDQRAAATYELVGVDYELI